MGINHGGTHISVTQQFLHCPDVLAGREQMGGKTMPKGMTARRLQDPRLVNRGPNRPLHDFLMLMMTNRPARIDIFAKRLRRKQPSSSECYTTQLHFDLKEIRKTPNRRAQYLPRSSRFVRCFGHRISC
jgi:hypothetical protein